jgi:transcriptional regulator with XRE-family HTH domain
MSATKRPHLPGEAGERVGHAVEQVGQAVGQAVDDIGSYIRSQRESAQVSLRQLARMAGVSNPYLSQIERGLRKPSAEILQQIAKGLQISAEALYVKAGILDEKPASAVTDAVRADPGLTERQKQVLLDIYQSFTSTSPSGARTATNPFPPAAKSHQRSEHHGCVASDQRGRPQGP